MELIGCLSRHARLEALVQSLELTVYEGLTVVAVSERIADVASNFGFPRLWFLKDEQ